jgi:hypothetical protein
MQRTTIVFIVTKAVQVSGGFPVNQQELKNCTYSIWYLLSLVAATPSVVKISTSLGVAATIKNIALRCI